MHTQQRIEQATLLHSASFLRSAAVSGGQSCLPALSTALKGSNSPVQSLVGAHRLLSSSLHAVVPSQGPPFEPGAAKPRGCLEPEVVHGCAQRKCVGNSKRSLYTPSITRTLSSDNPRHGEQTAAGTLGLPCRYCGGDGRVKSASLTILPLGNEVVEQVEPHARDALC